ncbi:MAG: hypothetical protein P8R02_03575 [Pseudomonadales bacterium]|nr:hypothetical protein [Pseudomonadales bacterium]
MAFSALHIVADMVMFVLHPTFVAYALPNTFLAFLRKPLALLTLIVIASLLLVWTGLTESAEITYIAMSAVFMIVFVASSLSIRSSRTKLAKQRAWLFTLAFGLRDFAWTVTFIAAATSDMRVINSVHKRVAPFGMSLTRFDEIVSLIYAGSSLVYIPIVTYGALKLQLFDVDIRLKKTSRQSTLAAMFIALFFLISEGASSNFSSMLGNFLGIALAACLVFFLAPLSRWAEWVSSSLLSQDMQGTDYESYRKFQMYSAAVEETLALGEIGPSQDALLDRLRESLQIFNEDAQKVRQEILADN